MVDVKRALMLIGGGVALAANVTAIGFYVVTSNSDALVVGTLASGVVAVGIFVYVARELRVVAPHRRGSEHAHLRREARDRRLVRAAGALLPADERERYVTEWVDHVQSAAAAGLDTRPVVRSLVLRSVVPLIFELWMSRLRRAVVRG